MTRSFASPPVWDEVTLEANRRSAIQAFITERTTEGGERYRARYQENLALVQQPFDATDDLLHLRSGEALAAEPALLRVARYLSGPPVSEDDLDTLADARIANRKRLDQDLARRAAEVIAAAIDPERFPWLFAQPRRLPTESERDIALRWTAGLQTVQEIQLAEFLQASSR